MSWVVAGEPVNVYFNGKFVGQLPSQLAQDLYGDEIGKTITINQWRQTMNPVMIKLQTSLARANTNHLLHFFLSILTMGMWVPIWIMVTLWVSLKRGRIERAIDRVGALPEVEFPVKMPVEHKFADDVVVRDQYGHPIFPDQEAPRNHN